MQAEKFDELERRATDAEIRDVGKQVEAHMRVCAEIEKMKTEGSAVELSEEEMQMLAEFRRFKLRMRKPCEVFSWATRRPEGVQVVSDTAEVVHPRFPYEP